MLESVAVEDYLSPEPIVEGVANVAASVAMVADKGAGVGPVAVAVVVLPAAVLIASASHLKEGHCEVKPDLVSYWVHFEYQNQVHLYFGISSS